MPSEKRKKKAPGAKDVKKRKRTKSKFIEVEEEAKVPKAEFLDIQTIREGLLVLGCIFEIRSDCLLMSLPGCLVGTVPISNISHKYTEILKESSEIENPDEYNLESLFERGAVYPCKVLKIILESSRKPTIILSIDPQVVNSSLKAQSLFVNMVLYASVVSIEDHGYVMDTGVHGVQGFLAFDCAVTEKLLCLGQVLPTYVKHLSIHKSNRAIVTLTGISFEDTFPVISSEDVKLSAILPGSRVSAYVSEIKQPFLYLKFLNYDACSSSLSAVQKCKKIKEGVEVTGVVLYVHPVANSIYIHLGPLPTPKTFDNFFSLQKYDKIKNVKFYTSFHNKLFFKYNKIMGYVKSSDVLEKTSLSYDSLMKNPIVPKARVVFLHYLDNLIQLTFKDALLKMKIVRPNEVRIGDVYDGTVKTHIDNGMFVTICPGLSGFVRHVLMSDSFVTMPEKLYPLGASVKCRVMSVLPSSGLSLTCKESLVNLPDNQLLMSYEDAKKGFSVKGVIVKKTEEFIIVLFFNNIQGIASSENIPKSSVFYVGQTVSCTILSCNPAKKKLTLSLNIEKSVKLIVEKNKDSKLLKLSSNDSKIEKVNLKNLISFSQPMAKQDFIEGKQYKAFIKKITAHQINILVNGTEKGRIHITEIECSEENVFPLTQFSNGQRLKVYVLKEYERRTQHYLAITHRTMVSFLDCSLKHQSFETLNSGKPVLGFIRKIYNTYASVWLSPYQCGKLDFVNITENPKYLRKIKKNLKVGQSVKVSLLPDSSSSQIKEEEIKLTKPEISMPCIGKNVVGMLVVASPDKELVFKLPHGYSGIVHPTDVQDIYSPLKPLLKKLMKLKFILCHVLEVDNQSKKCILSLRKSRRYGGKVKSNKNISPELTIDTIQQGKVVKGYVKLKKDFQIIVNIGRNVQGKIKLHKCDVYGCMLCQKSVEIQKSSLIGNVIEVVIDNVTYQNGLIPLSLPGISNLNSEQDARLNIDEDIDWNEL